MPEEFKPTQRIYIEFERFDLGGDIEIIASVNGCIDAVGEPSVQFTIRNRESGSESCITRDMACDIVCVVANQTGDWDAWIANVDRGAKHHHQRIVAMR